MSDIDKDQMHDEIEDHVRRYLGLEPDHEIEPVLILDAIKNMRDFAERFRQIKDIASKAERYRPQDLRPVMMVPIPSKGRVRCPHCTRDIDGFIRDVNRWRGLEGPVENFPCPRCRYPLASDLRYMGNEIADFMRMMHGDPEDSK